MRQTMVSLLLIAGVISCSGSWSGEGTRTYHDPRLGFTLKYPSDWRLVEAGATAAVFFHGGGTNRQITVTHESGSEPAIAQAIQQFKSMPDFKEIKGEWIEAKGRRVYLQTATWSSPLGDNQAIRLYVPDGDHFYVVMGMAPLPEFGRYASLIEKCVLSFEAGRRP